MAGSEEALGLAHPASLTILNNLAVLLQKAQRLHEAEALPQPGGPPCSDLVSPPRAHSMHLSSYSRAVSYVLPFIVHYMRSVRIPMR